MFPTRARSMVQGAACRRTMEGRIMRGCTPSGLASFGWPFSPLRSSKKLSKVTSRLSLPPRQLGAKHPIRPPYRDQQFLTEYRTKVGQGRKTLAVCGFFMERLLSKQPAFNKNHTPVRPTPSTFVRILLGPPELYVPPSHQRVDRILGLGVALSR